MKQAKRMNEVVKAEREALADQELGRLVRKMLSGGSLDLSDSPKSFLANCQQIIKEQEETIRNMSETIEKLNKTIELLKMKFDI